MLGVVARHAGCYDSISGFLSRHRDATQGRQRNSGFYFPADPLVAVLEPGNTSEGLWLPGVGLLALLFGLTTLIWIMPAVAR